MRVVHFHKVFGALTENWISSQIAGLDRCVVGIYSMAEASDDSCLFGNVRCFQRDVKGVGRFLNRAVERFFHRYPQYLFWLVRDRANIVHAHFGPGGCYMWPFTRLLRIPLVTSFYGYDAYLLPQEADSRWDRSYRKLFAHGRVFLAEGSAMRNRLIELGCPPVKVLVHHIGVDPSAYEFHSRQPEGQIRLLVCGRFVEKKGIAYAIEALGLIRRDTSTDVHLTVVGDSDRRGTVTAEKQEILNAIEYLNLGDAVSLVGFVSREELPKVIQDHHILIVPSVKASNGDAEGGFPVIITEALATGMPIVAFDHCDIREIVKDGECGFLAPERDVGALAERLGYLIEHPEMWCEMGRAGRAHVEANYNIDCLNDRLVEIYERLLST